MSIIIGLLSLVLFITFIIGLIAPRLVLRWSKKPTRLKVIGYWTVSVILLAMFSMLIPENEITAGNHIVSAKKYIEQEKYEEAMSVLKNIRKEDSLYEEAKKFSRIADSLNEIKEEEKILEKEERERKIVNEQKATQKEELEREIHSISKGVDFSTYRGTVNALQLEIVLFGAWAKIIQNGEISKDPEIRKLTDDLKVKVSKIQGMEFPKLRKEYAKITGDLMWENDIAVSATGSTYKYINFTGGIFAANKNKQVFQEKVREALKMFRFAQVRYRWYRGDDDYTYWEIASGKDTDLVLFD